MSRSVPTIGLWNVMGGCPGGTARHLPSDASQNGMTGSDSQAWVMLRIGRSAVQSHKRKEPVNEESKVCRFGCPCRDDCGSDSGAERGGEVAGGRTEP